MFVVLRRVCCAVHCVALCCILFASRCAAACCFVFCGNVLCCVAWYGIVGLSYAARCYKRLRSVLSW